jgi:hypothetical protein
MLEEKEYNQNHNKIMRISKAIHLINKLLYLYL